MPKPVTAPKPPAAAAAAAPRKPRASSASRDPRQSREALMAGLAGTIAAPPLPMSYRLLSIPVAGVMLLLPAIYVALIAAVAWVVYWHATHDGWLLGMIAEGRSAGGRGAATWALLMIVAYLGPVLIGALLVAFMIKPFFSKRRSGAHTLVLERQEQPLLFEFADRLARHVGAPCPRQIEVDCDVNASARFRRGATSAVMGGGDLVLRIGLPLAGNLPLKNFAGILAHEFGHFAQRGGMTLTYVIRATSHWFARLVYERDAWDAWLDNVAGNAPHYSIAIVAHLARGFVWLSRRALWCLMMVGHLVSSLMLRQMEYDADRYEALLVGSKEFERTARKLKSIGLATHWAYREVGNSWNERRLPDDLPALIAKQHAGVTKEAKQKLAELADQSNTGWFDTHPADRDRINAARHLNAPGTLQTDLPASALFADFAGLSRRVTLARYFELIGPEVKPENLQPVEQVIAATEEKADHFRALARYTQGVIHPIALAAPRPALDATDLDATTMRVLELRNALVAAAPAARDAMAKLDKARDARLNVARVQALRDAHIAKIPAASFGFQKADAAELAEASKQSDATIADAGPSIRAAQAAAVERLSLALSLEPLTTRPPSKSKPAARRDPEVYDLGEGLELEEPEYELEDDGPPSGTSALVRTLFAMDAARPRAERVGEEIARLHVLMSCLKPKNNDQSLIGAILTVGGTLAGALAKLRDALPNTPYPYDHAVKGVTVRGFIVGDGAIPPKDSPIELFERADAAQGRYYDLYGRVLSDLVHRAEAVEAHLGLSPLPTWEPSTPKEPTTAKAPSKTKASAAS